VSLAEELLGRWAPIMRSFDLKSSGKGRFEVTLDGALLYSKLATGRFPNPGEIATLFEARLGPALEWRQAKSR
jgi:selT/selW/selH-like putative selenoprotein